MTVPSSRLDLAEYNAPFRAGFAGFAQRSLLDLSPRTQFAMNWHIEIIAAKLAAPRDGKIRCLIINLPPRAGKMPLRRRRPPASASNKVKK